MWDKWRYTQTERPYRQKWEQMAEGSGTGGAHRNRDASLLKTFQRQMRGLTWWDLEWSWQQSSWSYLGDGSRLGRDRGGTNFKCGCHGYFLLLGLGLNGKEKAAEHQHLFLSASSLVWGGIKFLPPTTSPWWGYTLKLWVRSTPPSLCCSIRCFVSDKTSNWYGKHK